VISLEDIGGKSGDCTCWKFSGKRRGFSPPGKYQGKIREFHILEKSGNFYFWKISGKSKGLLPL